MSEHKEILVKQTPGWVQPIIAILVISIIVLWTLNSAHGTTIKEYRQKTEDQRFEIGQLRKEIDAREMDNRLLEDDLRALGYRPVDLTKKTGTTNRSLVLADIAGDSRYWNKRQDIDHFLNTLLSNSGKISEYELEQLSRWGTWNAIDLTKVYWEKLKDNGITSVIAVGNIDLHGETFSKSNHSWLLVFYKDWDEKSGWVKTKPLGALIFEPTQRRSFAIHVAPDASLQYKEGYFYVSLSELNADIEGR